VEVFEMPFMMQSPEATSKAVWDYVDQYAKAEFKDVKALAYHVHGDGVFHMVNKPIRTAADLKGVKLRAPTRATNKFIAMLGATPVSMPVPHRWCCGALRSGARGEDSRVGEVPL
jgi:TRAP-type C4-dicarboxylate transport system substrate-binding protein